MDGAKLDAFISGLDGFSRWDARRQVDFFAYWLTEGNGQDGFTPREIEECFRTAALQTYGRLRQYLSEHATKGRGGRYVKTAKGYALERGARAAIQREVAGVPERIKVDESLRALQAGVEDEHEKAFLGEALNCFQVKAFRATIVMVWSLAIHRLRRHVLASKLAEFNAVLAANTDKRVRVAAVTSLDDFGDIPEEKFIEFCRSAGVVSNDVRKILLEKLGIRNTAAHPAPVHVDGHKATEFVSDLLKNVVLKYQ